MNSEKAKLFPLPKDRPSRQDEKRECLGLWKQGPLETWAQFEERVVQELMQAWQTSQQRAPTPKADQPS